MDNMNQNNELASSKRDCHVLCNICTHLNIYDDQDLHICEKCGHKYSMHKSKNPSIAFTFTALILYFPANMLPFMTIEMYGNRTTATIWSGIISLSDSGSWFLAIVIFIASMLVPFIKLLALFYLSLFGQNEKNRNFKTKLFHFIEVIGPWSMLDIFLLAVLVAILKFDSMANVSVGEGSVMFLLVVISTMMASANFDTKIIWKNEDDKDEN